MGADMTVVWVDLYDYKDATIRALIAGWRERIELAPFDDTAKDEADDELEWRKMLEAAVSAVEFAICEESREAIFMQAPGATWQNKPRWYLLTGGMSWGDSPTLLYDHINTLSNIGVFAMTTTDELLLMHVAGCAYR